MSKTPLSYDCAGPSFRPSYVVSPWQENGKAINYVKKHPFIDRRKLVSMAPLVVDSL